MAKFDPMLLDEIRASVPISDIVGRRVSWDRKTNAAKGDFWACCPFHGEKRPSFHCEDSKGRYHCFGCGASGDHFRFLTELEGLTFPRAVEEVAQIGGVRMPEGREETAAEKAERDRKRQAWERKKERERAAAEREEAKKVGSAGAIWRSTLPLPGSLAEIYLLARGLPPSDDPNLRFHPRLPHKASGESFPALVGRVQGPDGAGRAVWRIFLKPDGSDKAFGKDSQHDAKLGFGPAGGGAVRLGGEGATIGIGEGIETCLAARILDHRYPIWAGLSTSGIVSFEPPAFVERILIFPDGDKPKRRDGVDYGPPGMQAALKLKARMDDCGLSCAIIEPPVRGDYLDVLVRSRQPNP